MRESNFQSCAGSAWRIGLFLLAAFAVISTCTASHAQTLIGSPGAGWQTWSVQPISYSQTDLNENGAPYWDTQWGASGSYEGNPAEKTLGTA